jgi:hypothetical protein
VTLNPFPGADPYDTADRPRFFGREEISSKLAESVLGNRCITLYGPLGAGKTSLLRASVLPALAETQDVRVVSVSGWPLDEDATHRLVAAMYGDLALGEPTADLSPGEALIDGAKRAARASSRLMVVCLDQIEQLFYPGRPAASTDAFLTCLEELMELPLRPVRIVLALREDYLGRFLERLQGRLRMLEQYFRLCPLSVGEVTAIVCRTAATGEPPQSWSPAEIRPLIHEMRVHDQAPGDGADVRLSNVQHFCRALFERRSAGAAVEDGAIRRELAAYIERTVVDFKMEEPPRRDAGEPEVEK